MPVNKITLFNFVYLPKNSFNSKTTLVQNEIIIFNTGDNDGYSTTYVNRCVELIFANLAIVTGIG